MVSFEGFAPREIMTPCLRLLGEANRSSLDVEGNASVARTFSSVGLGIQPREVVSSLDAVSQKVCRSIRVHRYSCGKNLYVGD